MTNPQLQRVIAFGGSNIISQSVITTFLNNSLTTTLSSDNTTSGSDDPAKKKIIPDNEPDPQPADGKPISLAVSFGYGSKAGVIGIEQDPDNNAWYIVLAGNLERQVIIDDSTTDSAHNLSVYSLPMASVQSSRDQAAFINPSHTTIQGSGTESNPYIVKDA